MSMPEEAKTYLTEEDFHAFTGTVDTKNYGLSFREAGAPTINRLNQGCGAKPHDILAKSIKCPPAMSSAQYFRDREGLTFDDANAATVYGLINGFVGYREPSAEGKSVLKGLYLTELGYRVLEASGRIDKSEYTIHTGTNRRKALVVKNWLSSGFASIIAEYACCFFTGDYDTMDCIATRDYAIEPEFNADLIDKYDGGPNVGGISPREYVEMFRKLNMVLIDRCKGINTIKEISGDMFDKDLFWKDYKRIQHGPQFGYLAYVLNNEVHEGEPLKISNVVADFAYPLLFLRPQTACTLVTGKDRNAALAVYREIIENYGLKIKARWEFGPAEYKEYVERIAAVYAHRVIFV